jgi:rubredoxin
MAVVAKSFVILALSNLDEIARISPKTKWEDVPEDWVCPDCGANKSDFDMVEI